MIVFLEGIVEVKKPAEIVMNVGGIGYEVFIPLSSYDRLPLIGETCRVIIHEHIKEDSHTLYGFMSDEEKGMFEALVSVSGIGPKLGLSALSGLSVRELKLAVIDGDIKRLSSISGVGKRMAERMAVELKNKISIAESLEAIAGGSENSLQMRKTKDALMALIALGFKEEKARNAIIKISDSEDISSLDVEQIIKKVLSGK
ncbi:MAG: Holliday junction branch migration protein RuvA [Kiritimatiellae bacterium]|jgi:Holliday junction DNA helicase RuvA|nr:Holliday junction branch migration protein RuvA [Kiritimatiellia bacterium]